MLSSFGFCIENFNIVFSVIHKPQVYSWNCDSQFSLTVNIRVVEKHQLLCDPWRNACRKCIYAKKMLVVEANVMLSRQHI